MIKWEQTMEIKILRHQGKSLRQIAEEMGLSINTVRKYINCEGNPSYKERPPVIKKLDPYREYLGVEGPFVSKFTLCDFAANNFNFEKLASPAKVTIKCANGSFESYIMQDFSFPTSNGFYYSTKKCQKSAIST